MEDLLSILKRDAFTSERELKILLNISQSIIGTLDNITVLQIISDGIADLFEIETAAIYFLKSDSEVYLEATTPALDSDMPEFLRIAKISDHPHIQKTISLAKPIYLSDTEKIQLTEAEKKVIEIRNLRSLLYFPFIREGKVLGLLILGTCKKAKKYTLHQIELCQAVTNQLMVAAQNTRLHDELKKHKDNLEKIVVERTHELEAMNEEYLCVNEELQATNEELSDKNITILKQKEELENVLYNLKSTQTQLVQSEKMASLGVLTAGVAHEINNPLNFISVACDGLEEIHAEKSYLTCSDNISFFLNSIRSGVDRASGIVKSLNMFSRNSNSQSENCDLHEIIDQCLVMLNNQFKHRIKIEKNYASGRIVLNGNYGNLSQVFVNILVNAEQAIKDTGTISIKTSSDSKKATILISDTGEGIEPKNLKKLTDPFFTTKAPGKGTGLGLSISYNILKDLSGLLEFDSEPGKGTTVKILIPIN